MEDYLKGDIYILTQTKSCVTRLIEKFSFPKILGINYYTNLFHNAF